MGGGGGEIATLQTGLQAGVYALTMVENLPRSSQHVLGPRYRRREERADVLRGTSFLGSLVSEPLVLVLAV